MVATVNGDAFVQNLVERVVPPSHMGYPEWKAGGSCTSLCRISILQCETNEMDMKILIVGAGIAGLAVAVLLARQGHELSIIDHRSEGADLGYAISLWPQGSRILHALHVYDAFAAASEPMMRYSLRDGDNRLIGSYGMPSAVKSFGHIGTLPRAHLIAILEEALGDVMIHYDMSIETMSQVGNHVDVRFSNGTEERFDLVIGADGMHSRVRELLFGVIPEWDRGWGCFVWWSHRPLTARGETREWWGAGTFLGLYPCRDRVCAIVGAPIARLRPDIRSGRTERVQALLAPLTGPAPDLLAEIPNDDAPLFVWRMSDVRSPRWVTGRVVLLGDAAAGFLPTAGIGASMALESAAVLADELSRTDAAHLTNALNFYVARRCHRILAAQAQSRWLARVAFVRSSPFVWLRDKLMQLATFEQLIGPMLRQLKTPI